MDTVRTCLCLLIIFTFVSFNQCGRFGGGRISGGSRGGSFGRSRSPSTSWHPSPSYSISRPAPSRHPSPPSPSISRPAPSRHPSPPAYNPSWHPAPTPRRPGGISRPSPAPTHRTPIVTTRRNNPPIHPTTSRPHTTQSSISRVNVNPSNAGVTPRRTGPTPPPSHPRPITTQSSISRVNVNPSNAGVTPRRTGPTPPPSQSGGFPSHRPGLGTTRRPTGTVTSRPAGWDLPPRPSRYPTSGSSYPRQPQGPPSTGYYPQQHTYTRYQGPSKVKIVNKYNYHYPGYYSLPVQSSYPGYYHFPSYYHYSSHDTGNTALGFFMGYSLARLTTPTYSHYSFYDGYTPRYDHYTVHHYYHNRESVPPRQEIPANTVVGCVGDSSTVCPANTVSLCTSQGALMCVVSATSTVPCANDRQLNCVKSTIPCINKTAPECKNANEDKVSIDIPCISTAEIQGNITYIDNTIIVETPPNATIANGTLTNDTHATIVNGTLTNDTLTTTTTPKYSTKYPITTTPVPETANNSTVQKRSTASQNFCITVLALPAEKKETEGEKLYDDAKEIASKFLEGVWGL